VGFFVGGGVNLYDFFVVDLLSLGLLLLLLMALSPDSLILLVLLDLTDLPEVGLLLLSNYMRSYGLRKGSGNWLKKGFRLVSGQMGLRQFLQLCEDQNLLSQSNSIGYKLLL
jgi:hypothetical protein